MPESGDEQMRARFGARVRELRQSRGWTEQELADVAGVTRAYINLIERGRIGLPKRVKLLRLAEALKTTPEDLLYAAGYLKDSELLNPKELMLVRSLRGLADEEIDLIRQMAERFVRAS